MKTFLQNTVNKIYRKDLEKLFGKNSKLVVEDFSYSTQLKNPYCLATLYVENVDECLEFFPFAIEQLIMDSFKLLHLGDYLVISVSIKELDNGTSTTTL